MKRVFLFLFIILIVSLCAGCSSRTPATGIRISETNIEDITPVQAGQFDTYTATFRLENPTNVSFRNVEVQFNLLPVTAYCHPQTKTVTLASVLPLEKRTEQFAFSEFSDLSCEYTYQYEITADRNLL